MQKKSHDFYSLISENNKVASLIKLRPYDKEDSILFTEYKKEKIMHIWFIFIFVRFLNLSLNLLLYFAFKLVEEKDLGRIAVEILLATILGLIAKKYNKLVHLLGFLMLIYYYITVFLFSKLDSAWPHNTASLHF